MNTIKKFTLATSIVFASAAAIADPSNGHYVSQSNSTTISTKVTQNKQASFLLGLDKLHLLESSTAKDLKKELNVFGYQVVASSLHLKDGSYVTVQKRMNSVGDSEYVSAVNVIYHYQERARNNH